jgi:hypothetical protein
VPSENALSPKQQCAALILGSKARQRTHGAGLRSLQGVQAEAASEKRACGFFATFAQAKVHRVGPISVYPEGWAIMKKLLATIAFLGLAGAASAADLGPIPVRPLFAPVYNWTGCYLGAHLGAGWTAETVRVNDVSAYNALPWDIWKYNTNNSIVGGGTLGCNWQPIGSPLMAGVKVGAILLSVRPKTC